MDIQQPISPYSPDLPQVVATSEALDDLLTRLHKSPVVAVDTESNSLFSYRERVCLIQFSIPGLDVVIDPLQLADLSPLQSIFMDPGIEKVFHAMDYDLIVLQRDYGFHFRTLFDTMWAARVLGWPRVGLGDILQTRFGIHLNKHFQRYNWGQRPLETEALRYASQDTHYLITLRNLQKEELVHRGRWQEAHEIFDYLSQHTTHPAPLTPEVLFWRIKGIYDLTSAEQQVLYQLHRWREYIAEQLDRPTFKVITDQLLVNLARVKPRNRQDLAAAGMTPTQIRHFGTGLLQSLRHELVAPPLPPQENNRPPEIVLDRYQVLRAWRKEVAGHRGVDPDVILPNATLWDIAWKPPRTLEELGQIPGIGSWRQATYGPTILRLMAESL